MAIRGGVDLEDQFNGQIGGMKTYGQSKLGNVIQSQYLAEKLKPNGIICVSLVSVLPWILLLLVVFIRSPRSRLSHVLT